MEDDYNEYYSNDFIETLFEKKHFDIMTLNEKFLYIQIGLVIFCSVFVLIIIILWCYSTKPVQILIYSSLFNFKDNLKIIAKLLTFQDPIFDLVSKYFSKKGVTLKLSSYHHFLNAFKDYYQKLILDKKENQYLVKYLDKLKPQDSNLQLFEKYKIEEEKLFLSQTKSEVNLNTIYIFGVKEISDTLSLSSLESNFKPQSIFPDYQNIELNKKLIIVGEALESDVSRDDDKSLVDFDSKDYLPIEFYSGKIYITPTGISKSNSSKEVIAKESLSFEMKDVSQKFLKPEHVIKTPIIDQDKSLPLIQVEEKIPLSLEPFKIESSQHEKDEKPFQITIDAKDESKSVKPKDVFPIFDTSRKKFESDLRIKDKKKILTTLKDKDKDKDKSKISTRFKVVSEAKVEHQNVQDLKIKEPSHLVKFKITSKSRGDDYKCKCCEQNKMKTCPHFYRNVKYFDLKKFWDKQQFDNS